MDYYHELRNVTQPTIGDLLDRSDDHSRAVLDAARKFAAGRVARLAELEAWDSLIERLETCDRPVTLCPTNFVARSPAHPIARDILGRLLDWCRKQPEGRRLLLPMYSHWRTEIMQAVPSAWPTRSVEVPSISDLDLLPIGICQLPVQIDNHCEEMGQTELTARLETSPESKRPRLLRGGLAELIARLEVCAEDRRRDHCLHWNGAIQSGKLEPSCTCPGHVPDRSFWQREILFAGRSKPPPRSHERRRFDHPGRAELIERYVGGPARLAELRELYTDILLTVCCGQPAPAAEEPVDQV